MTLPHTVGDVHRKADRASLLRQRPRDRLADPPRGVGRELEAELVVELLHRADQAEVALLDQVEQRHARLRVVARDRHHQPQVRLDQPPLRLLVAFVLAPRELALLGGREQPSVSDLADVELQRVVREVVALLPSRLVHGSNNGSAVFSTDALSALPLPSLEASRSPGRGSKSLYIVQSNFGRLCRVEDIRRKRWNCGMCGIAGYSVGPESQAPRTLAAQALLAGIAERGADAVGYAHRSNAARVSVHKQQTGASKLLDVDRRSRGCPSRARPRARLHEGPPDNRGQQPPDPPRRRRRHPQRRHRQRRGDLRPVRVRARRAGDDGRLRGDLRARRRAARATRGRSSSSPARWRPPGSTSATPATLHLARGLCRPLWIGRGRHEVFFASTRAALEVVEQTLGSGLLKREVGEGRLLRLVAGRIVGRGAIPA